MASSFDCTPGLPLHSRDLVNWTLSTMRSGTCPPRYDEVQHGCGIWAPAIRFHAGKFWIFFPRPDEGNYVTTAEEPAGQWSEPQPGQGWEGMIHPCPLWDDDGQAYLVHAYAGSRAGIKHVPAHPAHGAGRLAPAGRWRDRLSCSGAWVTPQIEGPNPLRKDGWHHILAPAGGVATGWQVALRS